MKKSKATLLLSLMFLFLFILQPISSNNIVETAEVEKVENIIDDTFTMCIATISLDYEIKTSSFVHKSHIYTFKYKNTPFKPPITNLL